MPTYGGVEMGGTKTDVVFGTTPDDMSDPVRVMTTSPDDTLDEVIQVLQSHEIDSVGVACFGPLRLDSGPSFGTILSTPKPGWSGVPVFRRLAEALDAPVALTTDVNGAAIGEGRWGATRGMGNHAYVTVGTGIGAGVIANGRPIEGPHHPEMGHISVSRMNGDTHPGTCPYHGDCLEGMAAGPALESRFGRPETWAGNQVVIDVAGHYVAQGMLNLTYTAAPERIVIGGGVSAIPGFHDSIRTRLGHLMGDYPEEPDLDLLISPPGLGELSGLAGALALASEATG